MLAASRTELVNKASTHLFSIHELNSGLVMITPE